MLIAMINDSYNTNKENATRNYKLIHTWDTILHRARKSWQAPPPLNLVLLPTKLFRNGYEFYLRYHKNDKEVGREYKRIEPQRKEKIEELLKLAKKTWLKRVEKVKKESEAANPAEAERIMRICLELLDKNKAEKEPVSA